MLGTGVPHGGVQQLPRIHLDPRHGNATQDAAKDFAEIFCGPAMIQWAQWAMGVIWCDVERH